MPVLSIYFVICLVFTILSMAWFAASNKMKEKKMLPLIIKHFVVYGLTICFCKPQTRREILRSFIESQHDSEHENNFEKLNKSELLMLILSLLNRFLFVFFILFLTMVNLIMFVIIPRSLIRS